MTQICFSTNQSGLLPISPALSSNFRTHAPDTRGTWFDLVAMSPKLLFHYIATGCHAGPLWFQVITTRPRDFHRGAAIQNSSESGHRQYSYGRLHGIQLVRISPETSLATWDLGPGITLRNSCDLFLHDYELVKRTMAPRRYQVFPMACFLRPDSLLHCHLEIPAREGDQASAEFRLPNPYF